MRSEPAAPSFRLIAVAVAGLAAALISGCGSTSVSPRSLGPSASATPSGTPELQSSTQRDVRPAGSIPVTMTHNRFVPSVLAVPAGEAVFYLVEDDDVVKHGMNIESTSGRLLAASGLLDSSRPVGAFTVRGLRPGTYPFYCPLHRGLGMTGTLTVN